MNVDPVGTDSANPLWNPWVNDRNTFGLYQRRCRKEVEEMTCAAQAAEIIKDRITPGETLLDAGCGGGYYYHSFHDRGIQIRYHGLDYSPELIELARNEMCKHTTLTADQYVLGRIENLVTEFDNILCFNVLTNNPHYALPLERLLACTRKRILIRENLGDGLVIRYTPDPYLDEGKRHIRVYHNMYPIDEITGFMEDNGFEVTPIYDKRSNNGVEMIVDIPHYWRILLGERK
jgi:SAM-dependent methyltransferase